MSEFKMNQVRKQDGKHEMEVRAKVSKTSNSEDPESFSSFHNPVPGTSTFMDTLAGPSSSSSGRIPYHATQNVDTAAFSSSSEDEEDNADSFDRESLLKDIDEDIKRLIERPEEVPSNSSDDKDVKVKKKLKEPDDEAAKQALFMVKLSGRDGAEYSLQIFMRNATFCRNRRERASRNDPRVPLIVDIEGRVNAIVPAGHKLLLLCQRRATKPRQFIPRGSFVLFRFYVDGEALSEGELHEATIKGEN